MKQDQPVGLQMRPYLFNVQKQVQLVKMIQLVKYIKVRKYSHMFYLRQPQQTIQEFSAS